MKTITTYLERLEQEIQILNGTKALVQEHATLLDAEFNDYLAKFNNNIPIPEVENEFVESLEPPEIIAKALIANTSIKSDVNSASMTHNAGIYSVNLKIQRQEWKKLFSATLIIFTLSYLSQAMVQIYFVFWGIEWYDHPNFNTLIAAIYGLVIVAVFGVVGTIGYRSIKTAKENMADIKFSSNLVGKKILILSIISSGLLLLHGFTSSLFELDRGGSYHGFAHLLNVPQNGRIDVLLSWMLFLLILFGIFNIIQFFKIKKNPVTNPTITYLIRNPNEMIRIGVAYYLMSGIAFLLISWHNYFPLDIIDQLFGEFLFGILALMWWIVVPSIIGYTFFMRYAGHFPIGKLIGISTIELVKIFSLILVITFLDLTLITTYFAITGFTSDVFELFLVWLILTTIFSWFLRDEITEILPTNSKNFLFDISIKRKLN